MDDFYDMDNYDDDDDVEGGGGGVEPPSMTTNLTAMLNQTDDDEDSPDDNLILCGHVDGDVCMLEVYVFNNEKGDLFILNDMFLPR